MPEKPFTPALRPDRQPRRQIVTVRVNQDELHTLNLTAQNAACSVSELIRFAIYKFLIHNKLTVNIPTATGKKP